MYIVWRMDGAHKGQYTHTISVPKWHECLPSPGASWSSAFIHVALVSTETVVFNSTLYSINTARPWLLMVAVLAFEH